MPTTKADFTDQTGIFDPRRFVEEVHFIGLGGIGASVLPILVTLGIHRIHLWDFDAVEPRNVASQLLYYPSDVNRLKTEVAEERLHLYGATEVIVHNERFIGARHGGDIEGVVIMGVDSMAVRQDIWKGIRDNPLVTRVMDGRIGGEIYTLIIIDPLNDTQVTWYEKFQLFDDERAEPLPCTQRAVVYPAVVLGGHMAAAFAMLQQGQVPPKFRSEHMRTGQPVIMK